MTTTAEVLSSRVVLTILGDPQYTERASTALPDLTRPPFIVDLTLTSEVNDEWDGWEVWHPAITHVQGPQYGIRFNVCANTDEACALTVYEPIVLADVTVTSRKGRQVCRDIVAHRFGTVVRAATYNEDDGSWTVILD